MRFSPSFLAVEYLRNGFTPQQAANMVIERIAKFYPENSAAIVVADYEGNYGASCQIFTSFPISIYYPELKEVREEVTKCRQINDEINTTDNVGKLQSLKKVFILMNVFVFIFK